MAINLEDVKNMKLPLHMVVSIVVFTLGTVSIIDGRYAHREEVAALKLELEDRDKTIKEQQDMMYKYFSDVLTTLKKDKASSK